MPGIDSAVRTITASASLTATNLAAGAIFTGPTVNGGAEPEAWPTRVRPIVRHLTAAPVHGYLVLEESPDNFTTVIETRRVPIPADGQFRTFDWPLHLQYHRLKFINGNQVQTGMRVTTTLHRGEGASIDEHEVLSFVLTASPLAANATFASQTFDLGPNASRHQVRAFARSDVASGGNGFRIEVSDDGATWWSSADAFATFPGGGQLLLTHNVVTRYVRVVLVNGAAAQAQSRIIATIVSL